MVSSLRYGIIGCGRIAVNHLLAAKKNGLQIIAICDLIYKKLEDIIDKCDLQGDIHYYQDYHKMIEEEKLDIVAIATDSGSHATIAIDCIKKGIHILIEKPIALSIADADKIIELQQEYHVKVMVCHQNRFNKAIIKIKDTVEQEKLGKLYYGVANIRWSRDENYYKQSSWRGTWSSDGGALMNQCIHNIDLLLWIMDSKPVQVVAYTDNVAHPYIEVEDLGIALIKFANGSYGIIEGTTCIKPSNLEETLYIFGSKGTAGVGGIAVNSIREWKICDENEKEEDVKEQFKEVPNNVYGYGHYLLYSNMIEAILEDKEVAINAVAGKQALEMILAIYEASAKGKSINLPLAAGATIDYRE